MPSCCKAIALLAMAAGICAETHLGGNLKKTTLDAGGNPYIIEQDVTIPSNEIVTVKPGCIFLFKPFTGIVVEGQFLVEGSVDQPVIFTSVNDQQNNPQSAQPANPFDWNGILVTPQCQRAAFKSFVLSFSIYGIKAQTPNITIQNGKFKQNGQFHFTINDKIQSVQDELFYSYGVDDQQAAAGEKQKPQLVKKSPKGGQESTGKLVFRWGCFGVGVAGIGVGTTLLIVSAATYQEWDSESDLGKWNRLEDKYYGQLAGGIVLECIGALGAAGFGLSFVF